VEKEKDAWGDFEPLTDVDAENFNLCVFYFFFGDGKD
jgi:hypothetical protein